MRRPDSMNRGRRRRTPCRAYSIENGRIEPAAWSAVLGAAIRERLANGAPDTTETYYAALTDALVDRARRRRRRARSRSSRHGDRRTYARRTGSPSCSSSLLVDSVYC